MPLCSNLSATRTFMGARSFETSLRCQHKGREGHKGYQGHKGSALSLPGRFCTFVLTCLCSVRTGTSVRSRVCSVRPDTSVPLRVCERRSGEKFRHRHVQVGPGMK